MSVHDQITDTLDAVRLELINIHGLSAFPSLERPVYRRPIDLLSAPPSDQKQGPFVSLNPLIPKEQVKGSECRIAWSTQEQLKPMYSYACILPISPDGSRLIVRLGTAKSRSNTARVAAYSRLSPALVEQLKLVSPYVSVSPENLSLEVSWVVSLGELESQRGLLVKATDLVSRFHQSVLQLSGG